MLWGDGIGASGTGKTISKNQTSLNFAGILVSGSSNATGNVVSGNSIGIDISGAARVADNAL